MSMHISSTDNNNTGLLFVGFNQDYGCFAVGMENGFRIFNTDPLKQKERLDTRGREGSGIGYVEMIFRTNFLGVLGGGVNPKIKTNMAAIWDDVKKKFIIDFSFSSEVKAIKLRRDRIILVLENQIKVYSFEIRPQLLYQYDTSANTLGLCAVCQASDRGTIAFPQRGSSNAGHVQISDVIHTNRAPKQIKAHDGEIINLTLDSSGKKLATASDKGTLIRIFDTDSGAMLHELRRGTNQAVIYSIAFNEDSTRICVSSNHGTIHVFNVEDDASGRSSVSGQGILKYFNSRASDFRLNVSPRVKTICAFSNHSPEALIVIGSDGSFSKWRFSSNGQPVRETFVNFLEYCDDDSDF